MIITAQLDRRPELRYTRAGIPVAKLLLLLRRQYRDKAGDVEELPPGKVDVVVWRELAERIREARLKPGTTLRLECEWQQSSTTEPSVLVAIDLAVVGQRSDEYEERGMELGVVAPGNRAGNVSSTRFSRPATMTAGPRHSALFPSSRPNINAGVVMPDSEVKNRDQGRGPAASRTPRATFRTV